MAGKSYIDCWPIYARHVVCVKFPFGTLPPRRMLLLVAQWQDPFSLQLQPRLHFIIFSRAHTPEHTSARSTHTLLLLRPLSPAIPRHTHSPLSCGAAIGCALVLVASIGHAQRELPAEGVACLCVCAQRYMRRGLAAVRTFPRMRSHGNPSVPLLSVAFGAFQHWMSLLSSGRRGSISSSSSQTAVSACFDRNNEAELRERSGSEVWGKCDVKTVRQSEN